MFGRMKVIPPWSQSGGPRHRRTGPVAGRHRARGPWDTNFFASKKPRHGKRLLGIF